MSSGDDDTRETGNNLLCSVIILFVVPIIVCLFVVLLDFLILEPSLSFTLHDVKLYAFSVSSTNSTLTSNLQINISCLNNDNSNVLHFDNINVYASYMSQQITLPTMIPPAYLEVQKFTAGSYQYLYPPVLMVWSPYLNGTEVPLTPYLASSLVQDETAGNVSINVKVTGRLASEFGSLSRRFQLKVSCPALIMFGNKNDGNVVGSAVIHPFGEECHVEV